MLVALCVTGLFLLLLSTSLGRFLLARSTLSRLFLHGSVAIAILPASIIFCGIYLECARAVTNFAHRISGPLSPTTRNPIWYMLQGMHGVDGSITTLDVQAMALLLLLAYGTVLSWRHSFDIIRLFKIARRRRLALRN